MQRRRLSPETKPKRTPQSEGAARNVNDLKARRQPTEKDGESWSLPSLPCTVFGYKDFCGSTVLGTPDPLGMNGQIDSPTAATMWCHVRGYVGEGFGQWRNTWQVLGNHVYSGKGVNQYLQEGSCIPWIVCYLMDS